MSAIASADDKEDQVGTRKFVALFATAALAVTMVGAGVSATFTDQAAGRQDVNVGVMDIQLTDITPGSYWDGETLVCPAVFVDNAYGPGAPATRRPIAASGSCPWAASRPARSP